MTTDKKLENRLESNLNLTKISQTDTKFYKLDKTQDWTKTILLELNEKADSKSPEEFLAETNINIELEISKKFKNQYGEYLLVKGKLQTNYITQCIRNLTEMRDSLSIAFSICFLNKNCDIDADSTELLEVIENNEVYELYYLEKGHANIAEMVHEQIYLNINQYPVSDPDSPLLWNKEASPTKQ
ncbi:MAG: hypothetical protein HON90_12075 [Halobacteriovoraceae bacterium]|jgi:uncharacterized protein|nr:hypothetical protein [Halobacteriovoraceae bacterium]